MLWTALSQAGFKEQRKRVTTSHGWGSNISMHHETLEEFVTFATVHCLNQVSNNGSKWNGEATIQWSASEYQVGYPLCYVFFPLLVKETNLQLFNSSSSVPFA